MRKLVLIGALLLGACGDGEDFALDLNIPAERAYADLSHFSGGEIRSLASLPAFGIDKPQEGEIRYILHSVEDKGDAKVGFRVESLGPGKSRLHVAVDVPPVQIKLNGTDKYISEYKAEQVMKRLLLKWSKTRASGEPATDEIAELNLALGGFTLALSPGRLESMTKLATSAMFDEVAAFADFAEMADAERVPAEHADLRPEDPGAPDPTYQEERLAGGSDSLGEHDTAASGSDWGE